MDKDTYTAVIIIGWPLITGVLWLAFGVGFGVSFWVGGGTVVVAGIMMSVYEAKMRRQEAEADRRRAEERDRREHREKQERARREHREEQERYRKEMIRLGEQSIGLFESMPKLLSSAEALLDRAENDFADSAFAPFWDSIENAAKTLAHFDRGIHQIEDNSSDYTELIKEYKDTPPEFPLARQSVANLRVGLATAERMEALVRKAQRNFQFAMIYEQRKTNQILVAGFTSLAHALAQMTRQTTASINALSSSIGAIHSRMGDITEMASWHHSEAAERQKKALEMLDNIQRGRRPFL